MIEGYAFERWCKGWRGCRSLIDPERPEPIVIPACGGLPIDGGWREPPFFHGFGGSSVKTGRAAGNRHLDLDHPALLVNMNR